MASDGTVAARLFVEVGARGLAQTSAGLAGMGQQVTGLQGGIGGLARAAGGIYAAKKAFDATIGSAIAWESEFAGVEKTVDASASELEVLEDQLLGMHRTMPIARADLAGIAEAAGALGIESESIAEFTRVVAMIGETTNVSSDQAANALGKLSNVLHLTEDDFDNFGAALVDLGNKGASTEDEILGIAERAGAGAALIGLAADATLGWSAAVANLGIEAEAGGSSLQTFFLKSTEHVAKAGEELDAMAQTAGMTSAEFARAFNEDASGALEHFIGGLGDMSQAQQIAMLDLLGFGDIRITRTILGLAGNVDNLTDSLEIGAEGWADNTALIEEYGKRADTAAARVEILWNRLGDLGRRLGESAPIDFGIGALELSIEGIEKSFDSLDNRGLSANLTDPFGFDPFASFGFSNSGPAVEGLDAFKEEFGRQIADIERMSAESGIPEAFAEGIDGVSEATDAEMKSARIEAMEGMAEMMDALNNSLRDGKDAYNQSWEDYLEGQKHPFSTARRNAAIAGQFAADAFNEGLHSRDPEHVANTVEYVNSQLREFELLNPGVLLIGQDVPKNLQAGMQEIMPELQEYVKEQTGETLGNLTLEEAEQLGIDGIYLWWQGMKSEKENAREQAEENANAVRAELPINAYEYGKNVALTFGAGIRDYAWSPEYEANVMANAVSGHIGVESEPDNPNSPLHGITKWGGNLVKTYVDGMRAEMGLAGDAASDLAGLFAPDIDFEGASPGGGRSGGSHAGATHFHFYIEGPLSPERERGIESMVRESLSVVGMLERGI